MSTKSLIKEWRSLNIPKEVKDVLENAAGRNALSFPATRPELLDLAVGGAGNKKFDVVYDVQGKPYHEATVAKCRNGLAVNYTEIYMRRRDPYCTVVGDNEPSDKERFDERYSAEAGYNNGKGLKFGEVRNETFDWLKTQELVVTAFMLGESEHGALLIAPKNASFFVGGLADLQGIVDPNALPAGFGVRCIIYLAPPFRHTHFKCPKTNVNKQVVVHNRMPDLYEIFSYNLYPGPSAKKGVYGVLLSLGESEKWLTLHAATVQVVTPYDNTTVIMHEGASGGGKSEMLEHVHREGDGRILLGEHVDTGERHLMALNQACTLHPVTDDMAMCPREIQDNSGYIQACDAERAWFVRLNHIGKYGTNPALERMTIHSKEPLIYLNMQGVPDSTILIWEHTMDVEDGGNTPCPNPRVIFPRHLMEGHVNGNVEVHYRNFGIRTPPCRRTQPSYGIVGFMHLLPPALGWLWRLVSPRGHDNPSITEAGNMSSEGVGSYWPFATGLLVDHANLLLDQIKKTDKIRYTLTPNQHVGAYKVSFMPQWIAREYLARRGTAPFKPEQLIPARYPILGYTLKSMPVEGAPLPAGFLRVDEQPDVGIEGYDGGVKILQAFFERELPKFNVPELSGTGKRIIQCCFDKGSIKDFESLL